MASRAAITDSDSRIERGPEFGYFLAAAISLIIGGAAWGSVLLVRIALAGSFTGVSIHDVNAHAQAQIFGWMTLAVMGAGYRMFPRFWNAELAAPALVRPILWMMVAGLLLSILGHFLHGAPHWAVALASVGGVVVTLAIMTFAVQMVVTCGRSPSRVDPASAFILAALGWAIAMAIASTWFTSATLAAKDRGEVILLVATWQPALRAIQLRGFALFVILGVALRVFPGLFQMARIGVRRAWVGWAMLTVAVILESASFLLLRMTGDPAWGMAMYGGWVLLASGVLTIALPWRPWRPMPVPHRANKFVRASFAWLAVGIAMLLLTPAFQAAQGTFFSHAWYGATRHAFTVGFISLMIVGVSSRFVPRLRGADGPGLPPLIAAFVLINAGCAIRVGVQPLTDFVPSLLAVVPISGVLELLGFSLWAIDLVRVLRLPELGMRSELHQGRSAMLPLLSGGAPR